MANFDAKIDSFQETLLHNSLGDNETLSEDFLNRQIDSLQDIINSSFMSEEDKNNKRVQILVFLEGLHTGNTGLQELVSFFDILAGNDTAVIGDGVPSINSYGLPVISEIFDEDYANYIDRQIGEIPDYFSDQEKMDALYKIYFEFKTSHAFSEQLKDEKWIGPNGTIGAHFRMLGLDMDSIPGARERMIFGPRLDDSLKNPETIAVLETLSRKTFLELTDLFGADLATDILYQIYFLHLGKQEKIDLLTSGGPGVLKLKSFGLSISEDVLLYSKNTVILQLKQDINSLIDSCPHTEMKQELSSIHLSLNSALIEGKVGIKSYISIMQNFKASLSDELGEYNYDYFKLTNDSLSFFLNKTLSLVPPKYIAKITYSRKIITATYYDFDIQETGMYLSTFLPVGVGNGLNLYYGIEAFRTGKSMITGELVNQNQAIYQVVISIIGLGFDMGSVGSLGGPIRGLLQNLQNGGKAGSVFKEVIQKVSQHPDLQKLLDVSQPPLSIVYILEIVKKIILSLKNDLFNLSHIKK